MKNLIQKVQFVLLILGVVSCTTYYIPIDSFKEQFKDIDSTALKLVSTRGPAGEIEHYPANPIVQIKCIDKEGNPFLLTNSPSIEMRITEIDNKRTVFYFDRVYLRDSLIVGDRSRFIYLPKAIPINNVKLIEVQDGHKNFKYVETEKN